jgi:gamma-glutamylcyclotransferase (GGCT)/AIG2-like uncharacterized protein YtfP
MPLLFSYGTLQLESVQLRTFGRLLTGSRDELVGFEKSFVEITDADVVATSGETHHPIVRPSGSAETRVPGTVFEITNAELASADEYEEEQYRRIEVTLGSGTRAWVYVDANVIGPRATEPERA